MRTFLHSRLGVAIVIIAGIVFLVFFQRLGWLRPIENVLTTAFRPLQEFFVVASRNTKGISGYFKDINELRNENEKLAESVATLTADKLKLEKILADSELIQNELEFITDFEYATVTGKIIGRSSDEYLQLVILNKGDADGIRVGYPVVTAGSIIGKVIDTNSRVSKILLLNDNQSEISAVIQNNDRSPGIVGGQFGIALTMSLIPQTHSIEPGQTVITSGLEELIPKDLIIGSTDEITKREGELFQESTIEPLVDYSALSIVTVILPFDG